MGPFGGMSRAAKVRSTAPARVGPEQLAPRGGEALPETAPEAAPESARSAAERRRGARREPRPDRALAVPQSSTLGRNWIPRRWPYLVLAMLAAVASAMVTTRGIPDVTEGVMLALALLGAAAVSPVHARVANRRLGARLAAVFAVVVAPMFLFGLAMTRWAIADGLP